MTLHNRLPVWVAKVSKDKIQRLYASDASGSIDEELVAEVGWELWSRCDSILTVTTAHYGRLPCPGCGAVIEHPSLRAGPAGERISPWRDEDILLCERCGWELAWKTFHQTYRGKQLFGANAVEVFEAYHKAFPRAATPQAKMLLIDQLIHAFHIGLTELGRPVGANLIQGSLREVILFLDGLAGGTASASGIGSSRDAWRRSLESAAWTRPFLKPDGEE